MVVHHGNPSLLLYKYGVLCSVLISVNYCDFAVEELVPYCRFNTLVSLQELDLIVYTVYSFLGL